MDPSRESTPIEDLAEEWLSLDQNVDTRREIENLLQDNKIEELEKRLRNRIQFGTAGLRAKMEAGFSRMNDLTVIQASQGLAAYLLENVADAQKKGVVIGYDHRHNSQRFAQLTACSFLFKKFRVFYYDELVPTPLVPFGVDYFKAACGVMITASHNPAEYNGYKVYWGNGCQIIPPVDVGISLSIERHLMPYLWDITYVDRSEHTVKPLENVRRAYFRSVSDKLGEGAHLTPGFKFVYTAMHGVGYPYMRRAVEEALHFISPVPSKEASPVAEDNSISHLNSKITKSSISDNFLNNAKDKYFQEDVLIEKHEGVNVMFPEPQQREPNPDFPTVEFPNPEEHGALNYAQEYADKHDVGLVIATDPDADRFNASVRIKPPTFDSANEITSVGVWRQLSGNELGILFAYFILEEEKRLHEIQAADDGNSESKELKLAMLNTTVSTQMLSAMAEAENFYYAETLTGFKWLGNKAIELEKEGWKVPFAFEEAIGYMFSVEHDKDGISAAVVFLKMANKWFSKGLSILDVLNGIYDKYGWFVSLNSYYITFDSDLTRDLFTSIRMANPRRVSGKHPEALGDYKITYWCDLTEGYDSSTPDHVPLLPVSSSSEMITLKLDDSVKLTIRGSGTEPKIKVYVEAKGKSEKEARDLVENVWDVLEKEWFRPEETGLKREGSE